MAIRSFRCAKTQDLYRFDQCPSQWRSFKAVALRKLDMLDAATRLFELRSPPGNRLEALSGTRKGQYSIRINGQWRLCFRWTEDGPNDVEIVDYH